MGERLRSIARFQLWMALFACAVWVILLVTLDDHKTNWWADFVEGAMIFWAGGSAALYLAAREFFPKEKSK